MRKAIQPLPQYGFMAWCLVKEEHKYDYTFTFTLPVNYGFVLRHFETCGYDIQMSRFEGASCGMVFVTSVMKIFPLIQQFKNY
jgi:hypothetical protein